MRSANSPPPLPPLPPMNSLLSLLDLPDELLSTIFFASLDFPPKRSRTMRGRVLHTRAKPAFALACTCKRLLRLFVHAALPSLSPHVHGGRPSPAPNYALALHRPLRPDNLDSTEGNPTASAAHLVSMLRLAGESLRVLDISHPYERSERRPEHRPSLDFGSVLNGIVGRPCGVGNLRVLRLRHAHPNFSKASGVALWRLLRRTRHLSALEIRGAETRMGMAMMFAALGILGISGEGYEDDDGWDAYFLKWELPSAPVPKSVVRLTELRLPDFNGDYALLATIISSFGPALETLEVSVLNDTVHNMPRRPPPPLRDDVEATAYFETVARRCPNLTTLSLGELFGCTRPLGVCLVRASPKLRHLTVEGLRGELSDPQCYALLILRAANATCKQLQEIHMLRCLVTGYSGELFRIVGARLRSFTGNFSWETSAELLEFSEVCPNVQALSLLCGDDGFGSGCDVGALTTCKRFGRNLSSLVIRNENISNDAFMDAIFAATNLEELHLITVPKLSVEDLSEILAAVGSSLRSFTYLSNPSETPTPDWREDLALLAAIETHCVQVESVCIPNIFLCFRQGSQDSFPGGVAITVALATVESLWLNLDYIDAADCDIERQLT